MCMNKKKGVMRRQRRTHDMIVCCNFFFDLLFPPSRIRSRISRLCMTSLSDNGLRALAFFSAALELLSIGEGSVLENNNVNFLTFAKL